MDTAPIKSHLDLRDWIALAGFLAVLVGGLIDLRQRLAVVETKIDDVRVEQQHARERDARREPHPQPAK